jgi:hypothetical protein
MFPLPGLPRDTACWIEEDKENACETWNLMWTWSSKVSVNYSNLLVWQRINHYPRIKVRRVLVLVVSCRLLTVGGGSS